LLLNLVLSFERRVAHHQENFTAENKLSDNIEVSSGIIFLFPNSFHINTQRANRIERYYCDVTLKQKITQNG
jgi:hypothetical protein